MAHGSTDTVTITVGVQPQVTGSLQSDARVTSSTFDPDNNNNLASVITPVATSADLSVSLIQNTPSPVIAGTPLSYKAVVTNNGGPSTARNVKYDQVLPSGVDYTSATISGGTGTCALVLPTQVECALNDLDPGQSVQVYIYTFVHTAVPDGAVLSSTGTASSSTSDPSPGNNTSSVAVTVQRQADVALSLTSDATIYKPSTTVHYLITLTDKGPSDAASVGVVFNLPPSKDGYYVNDDAGCTLSTTTLTCPAADLPFGATRLIHVNFFVQGSKGTVTSTATVTEPASNHDPNTSNNSFTLTVLRK
jgi:uncharacterized repeat protein (TIGR01451 family)